MNINLIYCRPRIIKAQNFVQVTFYLTIEKCSIVFVGDFKTVLSFTLRHFFSSCTNIELTVNAMHFLAFFPRKVHSLQGIWSAYCFAVFALFL